jgi:hypothetical protein
MKKSMKFATALAGAAVVVVGGSAYTAGNDLLASQMYGYGETAVSGVTVSSQVVNPNADDNSLVDAVTFVTSLPDAELDETTHTATLQVNAGGTDYSYDCAFSGWSSPNNTITCDTTVDHQLTAAEVVKIGLTVKSDAVN